jgi:hypothetical protein
MATPRYGDHRAGINHARRREKCGIRARGKRAAALHQAHRDRACAQAQFHVIHKRGRLRDRINPGEFHFVDSWG